MRRWILGLWLAVFAAAATGCDGDVVCEEPQPDGTATCGVHRKSSCHGVAHELTEADETLDGQHSRGSDTCSKLGYHHPYLGGYMKLPGGR